MTGPDQLLHQALALAAQGGPAPGWDRQAACHGADLDAFFPPPNAGNALAAARVCRGCPVRVECLADGIAAERAGLHAGIRAGYGRKRIAAAARHGHRTASHTSQRRSEHVAALTAAGLTAQQIAAQLGLSERTVQRRRQHITAATTTTEPGKAA